MNYLNQTNVNKLYKNIEEIKSIKEKYKDNSTSEIKKNIDNYMWAVWESCTLRQLLSSDLCK